MRQNLVELFCETDCPEEPITAKIWMLLQIYDCSEEILLSLERAIKLLMARASAGIQMQMKAKPAKALYVRFIRSKARVRMT